MNTEIIDTERNASGRYKVEVSRGENVDSVSSEWLSRPDDEPHLSLVDPFAPVEDRADRSRTCTVQNTAIRVEAHRDNSEKLGLVLPDADEPIAPAHWSFGQLSSLVGAPAAYLRQLSAPLLGINLQYGLTSHRAEQIKTIEVADGRTELRAVTGPDYGRIYDHEPVSAVQRIAGYGTADTRWKVPGVLDWSTGIYNPRMDVTKETMTLYASDRDVFLFLVDDLNPIETGWLPEPQPLGRCGFSEITIRHSKYAASRFAESSPAPFIDGIRAAREKIVTRPDDNREDFLRKRGFSEAETGRIVKTVLAEEDRPPESVFDFVQGITAVARSKPQQDARLVMEEKAKGLLEKVS
ncbi:DUF932 domain-containing protein [Phaeobacter sp. C3_T13_0]|uniref:DUF932 domain-containing protein n=1 Tax=Phaeobacter cretensis TaxID=3342641 RepID=UPI0039BD919F